ncbi:MAG: (2Fe-2S)-binding protein [Deltaproteobacteria bacterium]|nr:(2Fe-2S)-binding protein [Deltaproteobacteria bacterium]
MKIEVTINGTRRELDVAADAMLLDVLRDHGFFSVKYGCREGTCGTCTVLVDGRATLSCITLAGQVHERSVETVEALGSVDRPHPMQRALVDAGAVQCGFCTPGMLLAAKALLQQNPSPTRAEIARALDGNLCRCTGYAKILDGVERGAAAMRGEP